MSASQTKVTIHSSPLPLEPGTYRLAEDVRNPTPDGRANQDRLTSWECWKIWPKGMVLIIDVSPFGEKTENRIYPDGGINRVLQSSSQGATLLSAKLERLEEKPSQTLARLCGGGTMQKWYAKAILDRVGLTSKDIVRLVEEIDNELGES